MTIAETILSSCISIITCGTFAFAINILGLIIQDINKTTDSMNKEMDLINRYMNKKELSKNLKNRVLNYLEYLHGIHFERINVEEEEVVKKLS